MLLPSDKPLFENVSSSEYYTRAEKLRDDAVDGVALFTFPDFEEAIVFWEASPLRASTRQNAGLPSATG